MTRDYKPSSRARKAPSSGSGSSMLVGILIGLLLGLGIALGVAIYFNRVPDAFMSRGKPADTAPAAKAEPPKAPAAPKESAKAEDKPRFDFYSILPGEDASKGKPVTKEAPRAADVKETFYLQAGAFQNAADADNMKARLALLGLEATVQATTAGDRGTLNRVRIGPFNRVEDVNRVRATLKQNDIETTLIKGRDSAH